MWLCDQLDRLFSTHHSPHQLNTVRMIVTAGTASFHMSQLLYLRKRRPLHSVQCTEKLTADVTKPEGRNKTLQRDCQEQLSRVCSASSSLSPESVMTTTPQCILPSHPQTPKGRNAVGAGGNRGGVLLESVAIEQPEQKDPLIPPPHLLTPPPPPLPVG